MVNSRLTRIYAVGETLSQTSLNLIVTVIVDGDHSQMITVYILETHVS